VEKEITMLKKMSALEMEQHIKDLEGVVDELLVEVCDICSEASGGAGRCWRFTTMAPFGKCIHAQSGTCQIWKKIDRAGDVLNRGRR
jgi:hypothetical protein